MPFSQQPNYTLDYNYHADRYGALLGPDIIQQTLLKLSEHEIVSLELGLKNSPGFKSLKTKVDLLFEQMNVSSSQGVFFKLSSRSAKDITPMEPVTTFEQIVEQCRISKRLKEDLMLHTSRDDKKYQNETLYFVFKPWIPDIHTEYRCFIVNKQVVGCCNSDNGDSCPLPETFDKYIIDKLNTKYESYCIDFYTTESKGADCFFVAEINELTQYTDCIDFEFYELLYRRELLNRMPNLENATEKEKHDFLNMHATVKNIRD